VVYTSVMTGEAVFGVEMVLTPPYGVVILTVFGDGKWRVPEPPFGVWTGTELSQVGMVRVAVPPLWVTTPETISGVATGTETVPPLAVRTEVEVWMDDDPDIKATCSAAWNAVTAFKQRAAKRRRAVVFF
jgi:hypothetical protein